MPPPLPPQPSIPTGTHGSHGMVHGDNTAIPPPSSAAMGEQHSEQPGWQISSCKGMIARICPSTALESFPCKSGAGQDGSHHPCGFPEGLEPSVTTLGLCVCCLTANWWLSVHTLSLCLGRWHLPPPGILPQQRSRCIGPMDDGGTGMHHFWLSAWMEEGCPSAQGSGSCQGAAPGKGTPVAQLWDLRAQQ